MQFIIGSVCIALSILIFCIVLLAARNPRKPGWASDAWVGFCHSIVILMLAELGCFAIFSAAYRAFKAGRVDLVPVLIAAAILLAALIGVKAMRIKKRIAAFAAAGTH
jgi:hypothetical protein